MLDIERLSIMHRAGAGRRDMKSRLLDTTATIQWRWKPLFAKNIQAEGLAAKPAHILKGEFDMTVAEIIEVSGIT